MKLKFQKPICHLSACYECGHREWLIRWPIYRVRPLTPQQAEWVGWTADFLKSMDKSFAQFCEMRTFGGVELKQGDTIHIPHVSHITAKDYTESVD